MHYTELYTAVLSQQGQYGQRYIHVAGGPPGTIVQGLDKYDNGLGVRGFYNPLVNDRDLGLKRACVLKGWWNEKRKGKTKKMKKRLWNRQRKEIKKYEKNL